MLDESDIEKRLSPGDWGGIVLDNRLIRLVYDADSAQRPETRIAFAILQEFLWSRHAKIQRINL